MKILVVDDTEANRKLLAWILEDEGHEVAEATNGQEAIDMFMRDEPDLVLMDVMMPVMDGFEATAAIKHYLGSRHVPIIFLTALSDDASLAKCLSIGGDDFLSKPINEQVLQAKIKAHTRIKDLNVQINTKNAELKRLHQRTMREHEIAKTVFENAFSRSFLDCKNTRFYVSPATTFNGDILLTAHSPSGGLYTLIADFTGHGLPAALGALPLSQTFFAGASKGLSVSDIARDLNRSLAKFLPDDMFAAATVAELNNEGTRLSLWSGGMPDAIITDASGKHKQTVSAIHMPLGVLADHEFDRQVHVIDVDIDDRVYLYTDGIPEALDANGDMFGETRLMNTFDGSIADPFQTLIDDVMDFSVVGAQNDDITIIEITCRPLDLEIEAPQSHISANTMPWKLDIDLHPVHLRGSSPVSQIIDMMGSAPGIEPHKDFLHTIFSELFSNALEHGVLELKSELKQMEDGFVEYYSQREQRLEQLESGSVRIGVEFSSTNEEGILTITIKDSGKGFNASALNQGTDNDAFGRGVSLIETLCESVNYSENGTRVEVKYRLQ